MEYPQKVFKVKSGIKEVAILSTKRTWTGLSFGISHSSDLGSDPLILLTLTAALFLNYIIAEDERDYYS